jgi:hypothetical protein
MTALKLVMTTAGLGRFGAAQIDDDIDLTVARVGLTDAAFAVSPTLTALPGEFRRVDTVSGQIVDGNTVHLTVTDAVALSYRVRGFGLFLADGTLFAVYGQSAPIVEKASGATMLLALDIAFPVAGIDKIEFGDTSFLNPPASTTAAGVIRIATQAEVDAGASTGSAVTPSRLRSRLAKLVPVGTIAMFFGAAAPEGWAICDGAEVSRSDGAGTIATPDLRGRVAVGVSAEHALGAAFGQAAVTVTTTKVPTGITLTAPVKTSYAGNGTQSGVETASLADPGHDHAVTVDLHQPSLALHYIMKV